MKRTILLGVWGVVLGFFLLVFFCRVVRVPLCSDSGYLKIMPFPFWFWTEGQGYGVSPRC